VEPRAHETANKSMNHGLRFSKEYETSIKVTANRPNSVSELTKMPHRLETTVDSCVKGRKVSVSDVRKFSVSGVRDTKTGPWADMKALGHAYTNWAAKRL
jgi:hypothetical protein